jgi:hypothetical protein
MSKPVALYNLMKDENFCGCGEPFRDFLIRMIRSCKVAPEKPGQFTKHFIPGVFDGFSAQTPDDDTKVSVRAHWPLLAR